MLWQYLCAHLLRPLCADVTNSGFIGTSTTSKRAKRIITLCGSHMPNKTVIKCPPRGVRSASSRHFRGVDNTGVAMLSYMERCCRGSPPSRVVHSTQCCCVRHKSPTDVTASRHSLATESTVRFIASASRVRAGWHTRWQKK